MCSGHISARIAERTSSEIISRALDSYDLTRSSHCSNGWRQFMYFRCSKIENAAQRRPFPTHRPRVKPSHECPPSFQACASCGLLHNVQPFSSRSSTSATWTSGFPRNRDCFLVVHLSIWVCPECLQGDVTPAAAMFSNWIAKSSMMLLWSQKARQLRKCSRFDGRSAMSWCRGLRGPPFSLCCVHIPEVS